MARRYNVIHMSDTSGIDCVAGCDADAPAKALVRLFWVVADKVMVNRCHRCRATWIVEADHESRVTS